MDEQLARAVWKTAKMSGIEVVMAKIKPNFYIMVLDGQVYDNENSVAKAFARKTVQLGKEAELSAIHKEVMKGKK